MFNLLHFKAEQLGDAGLRVQDDLHGLGLIRIGAVGDDFLRVELLLNRFLIVAVGHKARHRLKRLIGVGNNGIGFANDLALFIDEPLALALIIRLPPRPSRANDLHVLGRGRASLDLWHGVQNVDNPEGAAEHSCFHRF